MTKSFSKASLIDSKVFKPIERDILSMKLVDSKQYSINEAKKIIEKFKGGI
ncbi:hypothetical protein [Levilactobacillus andaensis]|uniref:hypothetical protein n=1 Tax=Levilactobacillus andaensis TaxID=2799570 RepID=UPI0019409977|nr:hypothetical protein [Levilactobacillus andaensis]